MQHYTFHRYHTSLWSFESIKDTVQVKKILTSQDDVLSIYWWALNLEILW